MPILDMLRRPAWELIAPLCWAILRQGSWAKLALQFYAASVCIYEARAEWLQ